VCATAEICQKIWKASDIFFKFSDVLSSANTSGKHPKRDFALNGDKIFEPV
jgi:hypothetical protein